MFLGEYQHNIDAKGRVIVPAKFREELGEKFYITKGLGGCLWVFPEEKWNTILAKFKDMPLAESRDIAKYFFAGATEAVPDFQGRILIPPSLRKHGDLKKSLTFAGVGDYAHIWDTDKWIADSEQMDENAIAEKMAQLGI